MPQLNLAQALQQGIAHHQAGRISQAEAIYRQILARQPRHPDALHLLGVIAQQCGQDELAVKLISQAIAQVPQAAPYHWNLGESYRRLGKTDQAIACYRRTLALKEDWAQVHNNLGLMLWSKGEAQEAMACYRRAIALQPELPDAHNNLGIVLCQQGRRQEAIASCRQALALKPDYPQALNNLGTALKQEGQLDEALDCFRWAIALQEDYADAHNNLGTILADRGQTDQAIAAYQRALALKADLADAHNNLGNAWADKGAVEAALACYWRALALKPDWPEAHVDYALALLLSGDLPQGFAEYEWRWRAPSFLLPRRTYPQPSYCGAAGHVREGGEGSRREDGREPSPAEPSSSASSASPCPLVALSPCLPYLPQLPGRTLLVWAEQGFGDTIQFSRYVPLLAASGGRVLMEGPPELHRLLQSLQGLDQFIVRGQPLPPFDCHCSMMSLPLVCGTSLENVPHQTPYLRASAQDCDHWRGRLAAHQVPVKAGLVWAGNPIHSNDRNRSMSLSEFAPLAHRKGVRFYSLQKGDAAQQSRQPPSGLDLIDWTADLHDFADTAALVSELDLVICVDTAVAHLAGALGKPVWVLLPFVAEWRWLMRRPDTPWYPTMRLFRQSSPGDWAGVLSRVAELLAQTTNEHLTRQKMNIEH